jgi:hypothetical protein
MGGRRLSESFYKRQRHTAICYISIYMNVSAKHLSDTERTLLIYKNYVLESTNFWVVSTCWSVEVQGYFEGIYRLQHHGKRYACHLFLAWLPIRSYKWRQYIPPKRRWIPTELHDVVPEYRTLRSHRSWEPEIQYRYIAYHIISSNMTTPYFFIEKDQGKNIFWQHWIVYFCSWGLYVKGSKTILLRNNKFKI